MRQQIYRVGLPADEFSRVCVRLLCVRSYRRKRRDLFLQLRDRFLFVRSQLFRHKALQPVVRAQLSDLISHLCYVISPEPRQRNIFRELLEYLLVDGITRFRPLSLVLVQSNIQRSEGLQ